MSRAREGRDSVYTEALFSGSYFNNSGSFSVHKKESAKENVMADKKVKVLKIIVLILCILLLIEAVLYTFVIPSLVPAKISFSGFKNISEDAAREKIQQINTLTWMQFDTNKAVNVLSSISGIEKVSVYKHFPDRVDIRIIEREAVAKTIVETADGCKTVQIDKNGVLFYSNAGYIAKDSNIPLITGLPLENLSEGSRLPSKYRSLMEQIDYIRSLPQKYFAAVSEIQVVTKEYGNYELVLYPVHTHIRVLTDRVLNEDSLKYMMVALDVVNSLEPNAGEIDLRYGSVSYRTRSIGG